MIEKSKGASHLFGDRQANHRRKRWFTFGREKDIIESPNGLKNNRAPSLFNRWGTHERDFKKG